MMLSNSRKKALNKRTRFEINPKSIIIVVMNDLMKKAASTRGNICKNSRRWFQRAGITFFKNRLHAISRMASTRVNHKVCN